MTESQASKSKREPGGKAVVGRLFVLELSGNRVLSMNPDGSDRRIIVTECKHPDGIVVDAEGGHIYWTNMGDSPKEWSASQPPESHHGML
jgi:DNA-binding beta-propeller fold protein YncE